MMKIFQVSGFRRLRMTLVAAVALGAGAGAHATENGGCVWALGAESFASAVAVPGSDQTMVAQFNFVYHGRRFDDGMGNDSGMPMEVTVAATASKITHNWGFKLLGGEAGSYIGLPFVYQQLTVGGQSFSKVGMGNANFVPLTIFNHKGIHHWLYELELEPRGPVYRPEAVLNAGQHNVAATLAAAYTMTPRQGRQNLSVHTAYTWNGPNHATHYHSGNEFFTQFDGQQRLMRNRQLTVGMAGVYYQQTTDDTQFGKAVEKRNADGTLDRGNRGRVLMLGPQVTLPLGRAGGLVVKWNREMLVRNRFRGDSVWFNLGVSMGSLHLPRL